MWLGSSYLVVGRVAHKEKISLTAIALWDARGARSLSAAVSPEGDDAKTSSMLGVVIRGRNFGFAAAVLGVVAIAGAVPTNAAAERGVHLPAGSTVLRSPLGSWPDVIPRGFLGLGVEYQTLERYVGDDPHAIDPVFEQLIEISHPGRRHS